MGDVLGDSPAGNAGFSPGDVILSYDSNRVFRNGVLGVATGAGEPGERVRVEVMRDGAPISLYVPRGPLGVLLKSTSEAPGAN